MATANKDLIKGLKKAGFVVLRTTKHTQIAHPDGRRLSLPRYNMDITGFMEAKAKKWGVKKDQRM